jgi:hypothetical protein
VNVRRSIAAAAVLLAAPVLSSCGVNFGAQTDQPYNPTAGVEDRSGGVDVLNALVVSRTKGSGAVIATLVDNDQQNADSLKGVAGSGTDAGLTVSGGGTTTIPAGGLLNLAKDGPITVRGQRVAPGNFVRLTFSFDRAEAITLDVPVMSSSNPAYADVQVP